jgi:hypothetical protein
MKRTSRFGAVHTFFAVRAVDSRAARMCSTTRPQSPPRRKTIKDFAIADVRMVAHAVFAAEPASERTPTKVSIRKIESRYSIGLR